MRSHCHRCSSTVGAEVALQDLLNIVVKFPPRSNRNVLIVPEIIATLLNDGLSPTTGNRILKTETVQEMFRNQIPDMPNFGREPIPAARPLSTNPIPQLYPQPPEQPQGWGLTFMLTTHPGATGRGSNTAHWAGLPNLYWWCDREQGIGGMIATQILPYAGMYQMRCLPRMLV